MKTSRALVAAFAAVAITLSSVGCRPKKPIDFTHQLEPGQMALRKISPSEYPDFSVNMTNLGNLSRAIDNSAKYLEAKSSNNFFPYLDISHDRAVATVNAMRALI